MAQPTPYSRQYNFTNFQSVNPATPLPAAQVDLELNTIKATLDQTLNNLKLIQRDDTALANQSVGKDQLKAEVTIGINPPAPWVTAKAYVLNDTVTINGIFYRCAVAHTSGVFATDLAALDWTLIIDFNAVSFNLPANIHAAVAKTVPNDADEFPQADSAAAWVLKKTTWANFKTAMFAALGGLLNTGTPKTTPVNADAFAVMDSASGNSTAVLTWANLKATIFSSWGALIAAGATKATLVGADMVEIADSAAANATKMVTLTNWFAAMFTALGPLVAAATGKSTPVDTDGLLLTDSAASGAGKLLTWANLKATVKTYTDTLYPVKGFRNALFNGGFDVWQRGVSIAIAVTTVVITADRWLVNQAAGTVALTVAQQAAPAAGVNFSQRVQRNNANTNINVIHDMQVIESINCTRFQGQTVTLSFYAKSGANFSAASSLLVSKVLTGTGVDQGCASAVAATWTGQATTSTQNNTLTASRQQFSQTLTIPAGATEIAVDFSFTPVGTAGANDWFEIDSVQLEPGSAATAVETMSYGLELARCQRYLWRLSSTANNAPFIGSGLNTSTTLAIIMVPYPVAMAKVPTFTASNGAAHFYVRNVSDNAVATVSAQVIGTLSTELNAVLVGATAAQGAILGFGTGSGTAAFIDFNAELV